MTHFYGDEFLKYIAEGNKKRVNNLIDWGVNPNYQKQSIKGMEATTIDGTQVGINPLWTGIYHKRTDMIETLLKNGANPDFAPNHEIIPLQFMIFIKKPQKHVRKKLPNLSILPTYYERKRLSVVEKLINHSAKLHSFPQQPSTAPYLQSTPLTLAAWQNDLKSVDLLLEAMNDLCEEPNQGLIAMVGAMVNSNFDVVDQLIKHGVSIHYEIHQADLKQNKNEPKDESIADVFTNENLDPFLKGFNANLYAVTNDGLLPIGESDTEVALTNEVKRIVTEEIKYLINRGVSINDRNSKGMTLLMLYALQGKSEMVKLFINNGANVSLRDENGQTALDYAREGKKNKSRYMDPFQFTNYEKTIKTLKRHTSNKRNVHPNSN